MGVAVNRAWMRNARTANKNVKKTAFCPENEKKFQGISIKILRHGNIRAGEEKMD